MHVDLNRKTFFPGRLTAAILGASLLTALSGHAHAVDEAAIFAEGATLERVFDGGCVILEGVTSAPDGTIYFSDITATPFCSDPSGKFPAAGNIWRLDPNTKTAEIYRSPSGMSNAIRFDAFGNMIVAEGADFGGRRITKTDMATGRSYILTGLYEGRPYNSPNDVVIDNKGRIYFTDPRYLGHEALEQLIEGVYRLDPDGVVTRLDVHAQKPNGIAISPDQKHLYVIESDNSTYLLLNSGHKTVSRLYVYDLKKDGSIENGRVLIDWSELDDVQGVGADGVTVDVDGNLYIAVQVPGAYGIRVYSPEGQELGFISTGEFAPQNLGFGRGDDANMLYITAQQNLFRIRVKNAGHHLVSKK